MGLIGILRYLRLIPAVGLIWVALVWLTPLVTGLTASSTTVALVISAVFVIYEVVVSTALQITLNAGFHWFSRTPGSKSDAETSIDWYRALPYPASLVLFFSRRIVTATIFVMILSLFTSWISVPSSTLQIFLSGLLLAAAFWLAPLTVTLALTVPFVIVGVPVFLLLIIISRLPRYKKVENIEQLSEGEGSSIETLGRISGFLFALPLLSLIFLNDMLPTNPKTIPPEEVPEGLAADKYYELGTKYKDAGWILQSKMALAKAISLGAGTDIGAKAQRYMDTKLPRNMVPAEATQRNVTGFNQMFGGDNKGAKQTYEELIAEYPDFEWPYSNLSSIYIKEKNYERAKELLEKALAINPSYINAWLHLADVFEKSGDLDGALNAVQRACDLDPDDSTTTYRKVTIEKRIKKAN